MTNTNKNTKCSGDNTNYAIQGDPKTIQVSLGSEIYITSSNPKYHNAKNSDEIDDDTNNITCSIDERFGFHCVTS